MSKEVIFAGLLAVGCLVLVVVAFIAPHKPQPSDTVKTDTTETVSPETDITGTTSTGGTTGTIAQNTTGFTTAGSTAGSTTAGFTSGGFTSATGGTTGGTTSTFTTGGTTSTFTGGGTTAGFTSGSTTSGFATGGTTSTFTGGGSTGGFSTGGSTGGASTGTGTGTGGPTTLNASEKTHIVAAGETLGEISQKYYGSGKYWKKIVEANAGLDPKSIKVGQKLIIPALSETAPDTHTPTTGPGERTYTVKSGDSYYTIAKRELGQASRWKEIERLNGIGPEELHVGQVIKLPAKKDSGSATGGTAAPDSHATGSTGKVHTVAAGETLSDISKQYFGTTTRWKDIVKANPGVDPEALKVGQKLTIPDAPADGSSSSSNSSNSSNLAGDGAEYVVKKGDTLPVIAERELGNKNDWKKILAANPGLEPTKLRVGQKIKLPANGRSKAPAIDDTRPSRPLAPAGGTTFGSGTSGAYPAAGGTTSGPSTFTTGGSTGTFTGGSGSSTGSYTAGSGTTTGGYTGGGPGFSTTSGTTGSATTGSPRRSDTLAPP